MSKIADGMTICDWLLEGLSYYLPDEVWLDFQNVPMAGHNCDSKVAFRLALGRTSQTTKLKFSALVGVDLVDDMACSQQKQLQIHTYKSHSFNFIIPTLVIGSCLGSVKRNPLFPVPQTGSTTMNSSMNAQCRLIILWCWIMGMWISQMTRPEG